LCGLPEEEVEGVAEENAFCLAAKEVRELTERLGVVEGRGIEGGGGILFSYGFKLGDDVALVGLPFVVEL